jgi:exopolysaccharide biosynthesis polyprenyl glycosylphosphotransferase
MNISDQNEIIPQSPPLTNQTEAVGQNSLFRNRQSLSWLLFILDVVGMTVIYHLVDGIRTRSFPIELYKSNRFLVLMSVLMVSLYLFDCYRIDRHQKSWAVVLRTVFSISISGLFIGLSIYLFGPEFLPGGYNVLGRSVLIPALIIFSGYAVLSRILFQRAVRDLIGRTRWLIIACEEGDGLNHFLKSFKRHGSPGDLVVLSDKISQLEYPITGNWNELESKLKERWTGLVLIGGWQIPAHMIERIMHARLRGLRIYDIGEFYERMWEKLPVYHLHHGWFAVASGFALLHERNAARLKRICDLLVSTLLLALSLPMLILVYIIVRSDSSGPGFFSQRRIGLNGKEFVCWKFRTMVPGSDLGNKYTVSNDSRLTRIGHFLRKYRIDEFPQLWNVLRGEMSFIGPRAEWTKCVADYIDIIPFYQLRHLVKPGLTGWAQVNYPYGASVDDAREKLEYDLYYLKNQSLSLDIVILVRTIKVVLLGIGSR